MNKNDTKNYYVVKLKREPFSNNVTIEYPDGNSDYLDHLNAKYKLIGLGVKNPDVVLDYIWNFYEATIKLSKPTIKEVSN